jgi:hypothetical protein
MATTVENAKNFKVLKMTSSECKSLHWGVSEGIICTHCNNIISDKTGIYYICVLHDTMCKECYEEWLEGATHYPEDMNYEDRVYRRVTKALESEVNNTTI